MGLSEGEWRAASEAAMGRVRAALEPDVAMLTGPEAPEGPLMLAEVVVVVRIADMEGRSTYAWLDETHMARSHTEGLLHWAVRQAADWPEEGER